MSFTFSVWFSIFFFFRSSYSIPIVISLFFFLMTSFTTLSTTSFFTFPFLSFFYSSSHNVLPLQSQPNLNCYSCNFSEDSPMSLKFLILFCLQYILNNGSFDNLIYILTFHPLSPHLFSTGRFQLHDFVIRKFQSISSDNSYYPPSHLSTPILNTPTLFSLLFFFSVLKNNIVFTTLNVYKLSCISTSYQTGLPILYNFSSPLFYFSLLLVTSDNETLNKNEIFNIKQYFILRDSFLIKFYEK